MDDHIVHLGKGRTFRAGQRDFIDPTVAKPLLTECVGVKLDRKTHAKLKIAAAKQNQPVTAFVRDRIDAAIAEDEAVPTHREPWR